MKVARVEDKYVITSQEYALLKELIKPFTKIDQGKQYWIRSLYFDTYHDSDYNSKLVGENIRKKIRLRIYSTDTDKVKLEMKNKEGKFSEKETLTISKAEAYLMIKGDFDFLLGYADSVAGKIYALSKRDRLVPKVLVDYHREAYYLDINDIRITFDKEIKAGLSENLFSEDVDMYPLHDKDKMVLEMKYNRFLPDYLMKLVSTVSPTQVSVSKYTMAREKFKNM